VINQLIALLKASAVYPAVFKTVKAAEDLEPTADTAHEYPAVFFFPGKDSGGRAISHNPVNQEITRLVNCYVVGPVEDMQDLVDALRPVILTYKHSPQHSRLTLAEGNPWEIKGDMWWVETYQTSYNQN